MERLVGSNLTAEQDYALETAGFLVIPDALSPEELGTMIAQEGNSECCAVNNMLSLDGRLATTHPTLAACRGTILGSTWHIAAPPRVLTQRSAGESAMMNVRQPGYAIYQGERRCRALTAVWALTDTVPGGGYVVLGASHKSRVPTPHSFHDGSGLGWLERRGIQLEPQLRAGSLMLMVGGVLHGLRPGRRVSSGRQRLVECMFRQGVAPLSAHALSQLPSALPWTASLDPLQRRVVGLEASGSVCLCAAPKDQHAEGGARAVDEVMVVDDSERRREQYMWDLCGWLVIKGVMDSCWLAAANTAVDVKEPSNDLEALAAAGQTEVSFAEQYPNGYLGEQVEVSAQLVGSAGVRLRGEMTWDPPLCSPFHAMVGHSALMERLDWIMGPGARMDDDRGLILSPLGTQGHSLHSGPTTESGGFVPPQLGWVESVNVAWQLRDVPPRLGGFCAIPGKLAGLVACVCVLVNMTDLCELVSRREWAETALGDWFTALCVPQAHTSPSCCCHASARPLSIYHK
jgi:hypothetical protein